MIADFLFEKDKIFAYLNLDNEELKLYERYFERFAAEAPKPELVIYLQANARSPAGAHCQERRAGGIAHFARLR